MPGVGGSGNPGLTRTALQPVFYHNSFDLPSIAAATSGYLAAQPGSKRWVSISAEV